jgi:hypothetical protein
MGVLLGVQNPSIALLHVLNGTILRNVAVLLVDSNRGAPSNLIHDIVLVCIHSGYISNPKGKAVTSDSAIQTVSTPHSL